MKKIVLRCKKIMVAVVLVMITLCLVAPAIRAKSVNYGGHSIDRTGSRREVSSGYISRTKVSGYDKSGYALNMVAGASMYGYDISVSKGLGTAKVDSKPYPDKFNACHCFGIGEQLDYDNTYWYQN